MTRVLPTRTAPGGDVCVTLTMAVVLVVGRMVSGLVTVAVMVWSPAFTAMTLKVKFWLAPGARGPTVTVCGAATWRPAVVVNVRVVPLAGSGPPMTFVTVTVTVAVLPWGSEAGAMMASISVTPSNWKAPMSMGPIRIAPRASTITADALPVPMARLPGKRATVARAIALSGA